MHDKRKIIIPILVVLILSLAGVWYLSTWDQATDEDLGLSSSGTVEAVEVMVAPEVSGRVVEVLAEEGQRVEIGQALFRLDGSLLEAQRAQAETALASAQAGVEVANTSMQFAQAALDSAIAQYDLELLNARLLEQPQRISDWSADQPTEFEMPVWYFTRAEELAAAQDEVQDAWAVLEAEKTSYANLTNQSDYPDLADAEERLAQAQHAFLVAQDVLDLAQGQNDNTMRDEAQSAFDAAEAEVEAAQEDYDALLSEDEANVILEGRAKLAVAQEWYDAALDRYNAMLTGEDSLRVQAAKAAVRQAESNLKQADSMLAQAQTAVEQAQAQIDLIDVQIEKLTVYAAASGVVLSRNIEVGEVVAVGAEAMTIGQLERLSITVYIPEDRYGEIMLGQAAEVTVDSFPDKVFWGTVVRIADQAEFTPRNVQTDEGRRTTVFAVKLMVDDPSGELKPGMPADVVFEE